MDPHGEARATSWNNGSPTTPLHPRARMTLPGHLTYPTVLDHNGPSTPEPMDLSPSTPIPSLLSSSSRPLPKLRIRRRRNPSATIEMPSDPVIPSIELSETPLPDQHMFDSNSDLPNPADAGLLTPIRSSAFANSNRVFTPPMTPIAQMSNNNIDHGEWTSVSRHKMGLGLRRSTSAFSQLSDSSSCSSRSSFDTHPSMGESCTSPESEADPFTYGSQRKTRGPLLSPLPSIRPKKQSKNSNKQSKFTKDMDEHLWLTYMRYLQDPLFTPFKMLPGTAPPLGVCHRVAREAKKTWKGPKLSLASLYEETETGCSSPLRRREVSVPLIEANRPKDPSFSDGPDPFVRSSSATGLTRKIPVQWPSSSGSTRRRLRHLCKRNTWLAPHYQRMINNRSPSVSSLSSQMKNNQLSSPPVYDATETSAFATRELNFTLATSTSATMQPGNPLSRLAQHDDAATPRAPTDLRPPQSPVFDRSPNRTSAHQKSQSLQIGLGLGRPSASERRLASPFEAHNVFHSWHPLGSNQPGLASTSYNPQMPLDPSQSGPSTSRALDAPVEIHAPRPLSNSMKRRAQYQLGDEVTADDTDNRMSFLQTLFSDSNASGRRRVRHRGFSLSAVNQASATPTLSLADMFAPPADVDGPSLAGPPAPEPSRPPTIQEPADALPQQASSMRRLGSPFMPLSTGNFGHTFPRTLFPHGLDSIANLESQSQIAQPAQASSTAALEDPFTETRPQLQRPFGDESQDQPQ